MIIRNYFFVFGGSDRKTYSKNVFLLDLDNNNWRMVEFGFNEESKEYNSKEEKQEIQKKNKLKPSGRSKKKN
jgi:hypothetical protein